MARNPPWENDELILALDVYFREPQARQSKSHPAIADLSRVLRALPLPIERPEPERFRNEDELRALARQIRDRVKEGGEALPATPEEGEQGSTEGRLLYRVHKIRERKKSEEKKRAVLKETGRLKCEACGFDFLDVYGERGRGFAECHHRLPLSNGVRTTYLRDLAIVCSNCHRMLHRGDPISVDELRELLD